MAPLVALVVAALIHATGFRAEGTRLWDEFFGGLLFIVVPGSVIGWGIAFLVALPIYEALESRPWPAVAWLIPIGAALAAVPALGVQLLMLDRVAFAMVFTFGVGGAIGAAVFLAIVRPADGRSGDSRS